MNGVPSVSLMAHMIKLWDRVNLDIVEPDNPANQEIPQPQHTESLSGDNLNLGLPANENLPSENHAVMPVGFAVQAASSTTTAQVPDVLSATAQAAN